MLDASGCNKAGNLIVANTIIIDTFYDLSLNKNIEDCANEITGAKVISPKNLSQSNENNQLIHVSVTSAFFGFLDDMYIITEPYTNANNQEMRLIQLQSSLRIGSYDFDQNYYHVKNMLDCIDKAYSQFTGDPMPCSVR